MLLFVLRHLKAKTNEKSSTKGKEGIIKIMS